MSSILAIDKDSSETDKDFLIHFPAWSDQVYAAKWSQMLGKYTKLNSTWIDIG